MKGSAKEGLTGKDECSCCSHEAEEWACRQPQSSAHGNHFGVGRETSPRHFAPSKGSPIPVNLPELF